MPHPSPTTEPAPPATGPIVRRRFVFVAGASDKFWEIAVSGSAVTVCYGRNGTAGQTNLKWFADEAAAAKFAETTIRAKTAKGYREVG